MSSNTGASSVAQLVNNEDGTQSRPTAELGDSSCMASIMILSFNSISVKNIFWLMLVLCSWAKKEIGSLTIWFGSGVVKTLLN